ncbi:MAG: hypothetical protein HOV81_37440 [Kofleriaceae bacterium]|nr:hypothetical protein [Kofleriaceae bacterium]
MTARKDFKRLVRERMARTGESYMIAARHVRADAGDAPGDDPGADPGVDEAGDPEADAGDDPAREPAVPVLEMIDLAEVAEPLGFRCRVVIQPSLAERVDAATALARLRDVLLATTMDRAFEMMRSVVLRGLRPRIRLVAENFEDVGRFVVRAAHGIAGVSEAGHMLALTIDGKRGPAHVLFALQLTPDFVQTDREPCLILTDPGSHTVDALRGLVHSVTENLTPR